MNASCVTSSDLAAIVQDQEHGSKDARELRAEEPRVLKVGLVHRSLQRGRPGWLLLIPLQT